MSLSLVSVCINSVYHLFVCFAGQPTLSCQLYQFFMLHNLIQHLWAVSEYLLIFKFRTCFSITFPVLFSLSLLLSLMSREFTIHVHNVCMAIYSFILHPFIQSICCIPIIINTFISSLFTRVIISHIQFHVQIIGIFSLTY